MKQKPVFKKDISRIIIAITAWIALTQQFYLILQTTTETGFSTLKTVTNFFSYFTILTNLLVALCLTYPLVVPSSIPGRFFSSIKVQSAIAVYIFIVGLVYNLILRGLISPRGMAWVADNLLHVAVPVLFTSYWLIFTPGRVLQWKNILSWLIFPSIFLIYSLIRGPVADWYPYPFLHAGKLGYEKVTMNALLVLGAFLITGLAMIAYNRNKKALDS
ncbi:MAG: Pr6Pr family membrane protein [Chitinophagaceae bacterium]|nr:Pr6Pr family membrane protein [Chitinophagaceae bacterium]